MPIKIAIIDDFASVFAGTKKLGQAFDNVADSLDGIPQDAQAAERVIDAKMQDAANAAEDAAKTTKRTFSEAFDQVRKDAKGAGDSVDREMHAGTSRAGEATGEFKSEAVANFSEVASSFSGDMTQAADGVQGLLGGLAQTDIPGVGIAAGAAALLFGAAFNAMQGDAAATKQAVSDMYDDMIQSGADFLSKEYQQTAISKILKDDPGAVTKLADAQDLAKRSGQELSTVLAALAGDNDEQARVTGAFNDQTAELKKTIDDARDSGTLTTDMFDRYEDKLNEVRRDQGHWSDLIATTSGNLDTAQAKVAASRDAIDKLTGAFDHTTDAAARVSQGIGAIPSNVTIKLGVDDSEVRAWSSRPVVVNAVARVGKPQVT